MDEDEAGSPGAAERLTSQDGMRHWRRCVEEAPVAIAMLDSSMRYLAVSDRWRTDYKLGPADSILGRSHYDVFPEIPERWKVIHQRCLAGAAEESDEDLFVRADGRRQWLRWAVRPWRVESGSVGGLIFYSQDISDAKEAELSLRASEQQLRQALDAAAAGTWTWNLETNLVQGDERMSEPLGIAAGEPFPPERLLERLDAAGRARLLEKIDAMRRPWGIDRWSVEYCLQRPDGQLAWFQSAARAERDAAGHAICISGVSLDITARKESEAEVERSHTALDDRTAELERRTAQLSRLATDLTLAEQHAREQLAKMLHDHVQQLLFSATLKLDRLATRVEKHGAAEADLVNSTRGDINDAIAAARSLSVELFPPALHERGLPAALEWLGGWMRQKYGLVVRLSADSQANPARRDLRILLFESVRELLFNVVKHAKTTQAGVELVLATDQTLRLTVTDMGTGFDPAAVIRPSQVNQPGLGLFAIRERLALLGGLLEIESAPGRGARFTVIAPRDAGVDRRATVRPSGTRSGTTSSGVASHSPRAPRLRILIADDHTIVRQGLRELLADRSELEVVGEASDGLEAIAQAHALKPDVIVMDVSMPQMDGVEATRRIRRDLPAIVIYGLSTHEKGEQLHPIEEAGAAGYFAKGDDAQKLIGRLIADHKRRS